MRIFFCSILREDPRGAGRAPAEWPLHAALYQARPEVGAIIHSHPAHAMVFGATAEPLRPISHDATALGTVDLFTNTITNPTAAAAVERPFPCGKTLLLKNHGIVAAGRSVPGCLLGHLPRNACRLQLLAAASGLPYTASPPEEAPIKAKIIFGTPRRSNRDWAYWKRRVDRLLPLR